jgi:hypothetical protein
MPKYSISWDNRNLPPINTLHNLYSRILDVSYRMLWHQNQGGPNKGIAGKPIVRCKSRR